MIEKQFPTYVSKGAVGGDVWNTQVNILPNGKQQRAALQSKPLGKWSISYSTQNEANHIELRDFKLAVKGGFYSFRFKDWQDYKSDIAQTPSGTVNGVNLVFQLQKTYTVASPLTSYVRTITKPVQGTVVVKVGGVTKTEGANPGGDYTIAYSTGVLTFNTGKAPAAAVTCTFEFDKPARLVHDENPVTVDLDTGTLAIFHHDGIEVEEVDE